MPLSRLQAVDLIDPAVMSMCGYGHLLNTGEKHNQMGYLLAACSPFSQLYTEWMDREFCTYMGNRTGPQAHAVFGEAADVRKKYGDLYSQIGTDIRRVTNRCWEMANMARIYFVYLGDDPRGHQFASLWLTGQDMPQRTVGTANVTSANRDGTGVRWSEMVAGNVERARREQVRERQEATNEVLREVRSGYRGAIRAQFVSEADEQAARTYAQQWANLYGMHRAGGFSATELEARLRDLRQVIEPRGPTFLHRVVRIAQDLLASTNRNAGQAAHARNLAEVEEQAAQAYAQQVAAIETIYRLDGISVYEYRQRLAQLREFYVSRGDEFTRRVSQIADELQTERTGLENMNTDDIAQTMRTMREAMRQPPLSTGGAPPANSTITSPPATAFAPSASAVVFAPPATAYAPPMSGVAYVNSDDFFGRFGANSFPSDEPEKVEEENNELIKFPQKRLFLENE